ncbi:hypothetical protein B0A50_04704 [Salinomyces thailandicus]|uniref:Cytochrome b5 heme-binding domain-containing protein n=1 Tax=Salinomyces thailandicus TaxID=706561 RepID=A0A4U0TX82_9PEZI|nr:hypothetical protein B0A50_04704 [Salinomyces thailandica]
MDSRLRERTTKKAPSSTIPAEPKPPISSSSSTSSTTTPPITFLDILRILLGLLLLNTLLSYFITSHPFWNQPRPWFLRRGPLHRYLAGPLSLTDAQLALYNGTDPSKPIYLALNGSIYDVTAGRRIYGPGGSYHVFAGKDAARGFITGCFEEDATPDLRGVEWTYIPRSVPGWEVEGVSREGKVERERAVRKAKREVRGVLEGWADMFRGAGGKGYFFVGVVKREDGWLEGLPTRGLCESAERGRPEGGEEGRDAGKAYRGG